MADKKTTKATPVKAEAKVETKVEVKEVKAPVAKTEAKVEKKEAVKTEAKAEKKEVKAAPAKAEKKETKKATTTKKATKTTTKASVETKIYVQFAGNESAVADLVEKAKAAYVAEGHKESSIKSVDVYVKPEDNSVYYVINDKASGRVDLF